MKYNETRESALGEEFTRGGWGGRVIYQVAIHQGTTYWGKFDRREFTREELTQVGIHWGQFTRGIWLGGDSPG